MPSMPSRIKQSVYAYEAMISGGSRQYEVRRFVNMILGGAKRKIMNASGVAVANEDVKRHDHRVVVFVTSDGDRVSYPMAGFARVSQLVKPLFDVEDDDRSGGSDEDGDEVREVVLAHVSTAILAILAEFAATPLPLTHTLPNAQDPATYSDAGLASRLAEFPGGGVSLERIPDLLRGADFMAMSVVSDWATGVWFIQHLNTPVHRTEVESRLEYIDTSGLFERMVGSFDLMSAIYLFDKTFSTPMAENVMYRMCERIKPMPVFSDQFGLELQIILDGALAEYYVCDDVRYVYAIYSARLFIYTDTQDRMYILQNDIKTEIKYDLGTVYMSEFSHHGTYVYFVCPIFDVYDHIRLVVINIATNAANHVDIPISGNTHSFQAVFVGENHLVYFAEYDMEKRMNLVHADDLSTILANYDRGANHDDYRRHVAIAVNPDQTSLAYVDTPGVLCLLDVRDPVSPVRVASVELQGEFVHPVYGVRSAQLCKAIAFSPTSEDIYVLSRNILGRVNVGTRKGTFLSTVDIQMGAQMCVTHDSIVVLEGYAGKIHTYDLDGSVRHTITDTSISKMINPYRVLDCGDFKGKLDAEI
jgi:hypothetical protein